MSVMDPTITAFVATVLSGIAEFLFRLWVWPNTRPRRFRARVAGKRHEPEGKCDCWAVFRVTITNLTNITIEDVLLTLPLAHTAVIQYPKHRPQWKHNWAGPITVAELHPGAKISAKLWMTKENAMWIVEHNMELTGRDALGRVDVRWKNR